MKAILNWFKNTPIEGPASNLILRVMVGGVFFWEGMLKFVYVNQGVGRFTKLGLPFPEVTANFIGIAEIMGGMLLLVGLFTRFTSLFFILEMIVGV